MCSAADIHAALSYSVLAAALLWGGVCSYDLTEPLYTLLPPPQALFILKCAKCTEKIRQCPK